MRDTRIELSDTIFEVAYKMSEGNPGGLSVIMKIIDEGDTIDSDNALGFFGPLLILDGIGIYGGRIWRLYKDVCKENITHTIACIRAVQLGVISSFDLNSAIDNCGKEFYLNETLRLVKERLPNFNLID